MNSRKVEIKPIEKVNSSKSFSSHVRYPNTKDTLSPFYDGVTGILYTGLTDEDIAYFKSKGIKDDLSPMSDFWHNFKITLTDKGTTLYLENPLEELKYKFISNGHYRVATSKNDPEFALKDYYIVDEALEADEINKRSNFKRKANALFDKLTIKNKRDILRLYPGFSSTDTVVDSVVEARLYEKLEQNPERFILLAEDKQKDLKLMLKDLVSANILRKNKNSYYYGTDFLGHDEQSTIDHLEHPDQNGLKIDLLKQLEAKRK